MAFKKIVAQRLFDSYKISRPSLTTCRICSSTMTKSMASPNPERIAPDPGEGAFFRRSLHRSSLFQSLATSSELRSFPIGEKLRQELRGMDIGRDRIRLDGLISPPQQKSLSEMESELAEEEKFTVADAKKVMRLAQLEVVKSRLRQMENDWISYPEFFQICNGASSNPDQALEFAKMLDQSGIVIVLGNVVFLKPDKESQQSYSRSLKRDGDFYKGLHQLDHFQTPKFTPLNTLSSYKLNSKHLGRR
ncbi:hypothetical protein AABB24_004453 [Solanum stoloniferum]|uniref:Calcium uniporter protein n=1 Tax=Solanum stoloniferum TaxID=62892 RepID=A0ABD2VFV5_9SOLN